MSSPPQAEENDEVEEDVEFVSVSPEGPLRPVSELIDLLSDSEEEGCSSSANLEDEIIRRKRHVTSTLDRLAHQVAQEKQERADKCRAFQEKQISQKAHGLQELAVTSTNGINHEAKRCVDMWLKMPGLQPGVISAGSGRRRRPAILPRNSLTKHTCPVINCDRVYDNPSLLDGHLKRFDHSPCDPTISLKGIPSEIFACVTCGQHFQTKAAWKKHLDSKVSSSHAEGHSMSQTYQLIVCFACPACYLFFNLRDECLQHMSAKNHFTEGLAMNELSERALPVPVPWYAKNRLIALCKDVTFSVRCSLCSKVLCSHQAAQAHFNVYCRQGCAYAEAEKTVVQVMKRLQVRGQCALCCVIFLSQAEIERHKEMTGHDVEINHTMEKALLHYCNFSEIQPTQRAEKAPDKKLSTGLDVVFQKSKGKRSGSEDFPAKRQRLSPLPLSRKANSLAWCCECGLKFSEEATAKKHLLAVNQIFHQCGVCGKHMGESSVARLHMSRFHGGAHLSNILYHCRKCKVEMPRYQDILSHVSDTHSGHSYFSEEEVPYEPDTLADIKPSTSSKQPLRVSEASSSKLQQTWMCRMCEDIFDSEAVVQRHCSDVTSHSFQRFVCGHCRQRFFKESTVRRHCVSEHGGQIKSSHFCGLCDSMQFDSEDEFLEHYKSLHSKDYYCMDDAESDHPIVAEGTSQLSCLCPCMGLDNNKEKMKATYTRCMKNLARQGKCQYVCTPCSVSVLSYAEMKTHVHMKHTALNLEKTFDVECKTCQESFTGVPTFHKHYHSRHCLLEPCLSSRPGKNEVKTEPTAVIFDEAVEIRPDTDEIEDDTLLTFLNMENTKRQHGVQNDSDDELKRALTLSTEDARESAELEEALKRSLLEY
ncbi:E3 SUMO-protein ligase ZNF451 isoform X2 [Thalassophryne amazonica]|uniref:E3 SUMO-protein ligase ZNF451 isoform X2 n=1 Tax=Thalassophryne amazonica TaxID=390379 RepID=UPI001471D66A|nr:E3 SUMO-protein ligase ZNF451 isoform X2 [Thalassophryne amazonica]